MRISEAIRRVEIAFGYSTSIHDDWKQDEEAEKIAIEAMKKQIPMMVTGHKHIYPNEYGVTMVEIECPNCGSCFEFESLRCYEPEYCDECGQKLDWED